MSLFRAAALNNTDPALGPAVQWSPPRYRALLGALFLALFLAATLLLTLPYTRKITVSGVVEAPVRPGVLLAPVAGRVLSQEVVEGDAVAAGRTAVVIDRQILHADASGGLSARDLSVDELQQRLARTQSKQHLEAKLAQVRLHQLRDAQTQRAQHARVLQQQIQVAAAHSEVVRRAQARIRRLHAQGWLARGDADRADERQLQARQALLGLRAQLAGIAAQSAHAAGEIRTHEVNVDVQQAGFADAIAQLEADIRRVRLQAQVVVNIPRAGVVADVFVQPGDIVQSGTPLVSVAHPAVQRTVALYLPAQGAARVRAGHAVRLRFDGYPFAEFGAGSGTVARVSSVAHKLSRQVVYRALVEIDTVPQRVDHLPDGMPVQADIELASKRLFRWLYEPLAAPWQRL